MLLPHTRHQYQTLRDAAVLQGHPGRPAVIFVSSQADPITITQQEFLHQSQAAAQQLLAHSLQPSEVVLLVYPPGLDCLYSFWGAILQGVIPAIWSPLTEKLDPAVYQCHLAELVRFSNIKAILTTPDLAPLLTAVVGSTCPIITPPHSPLPTPHSPLPTPPHSTAFLQHSSGTTGLPKGVALSHTAVLNQLAHYSSALQLTPQDVVVSWLPLYHDMGLIAGFLLPLVQGLPLVLISPFDWVQHPALLFRAISQFQGTLCWLPNFAYNHCARRIRPRDVAGVSLASVRLLVNCSEPVRPESHEQFLARFAPLGITPEKLGVSYAMAENTFAVTQTTPGRPPHLDPIHQPTLLEKNLAIPDPAGRPHVSCGLVLPNVRLQIWDEQNRPVAERQVGQIVIQSDCLLTEYYRRPDLTPVVDGWYLTGDLGYVAEGELYVTGRASDLIINAGKNIHPQQIEDVINQVAGVYPGRVAVFGVPDEKEGTELLAAVVEVTTSEVEEQQTITRAIRQAVAQQTLVHLTYLHLVPERWLIKTSSGKIARSANREKWRLETQLP